ncbi:MAG: hypothetical protein HQK49_18210 [Oligoflexia bacterium]|nr:hypothetical protein [Oligoflexia bacterium]
MKLLIKNIIYFALISVLVNFIITISLILVCLASDKNLNPKDNQLEIYLQKGGVKDNSNFKDEDSYLKCMDQQKKPKIVIVGSGRGKFFDTDNYAQKVYGNNKYNYFLINYIAKDDNEGLSKRPDMNLDIRKISKLKENSYDYCIFENVDYSVSFTKEAISGAMKILKPGGKLITSVTPKISIFYNEPKNMKSIHRNSKKNFSNILKLSNGYFFLYNKKNELCDTIFNSKIDTLINDVKTLGFSNTNENILLKNSDKILKFLCPDDNCAKMEFVVFNEQDEFLWPQNISSEVRAMIITKKK